MATLFASGNLLGFIGLTLLIVAGIKMARLSKLAGTLLAGGAMLFLLGRLFSLYVSPAVHYSLHVDYNHLQIVLLEMIYPVVTTIGFLAILCGVTFHARDELPATSRADAGS